jgi:hypothetical protein
MGIQWELYTDKLIKIHNWFTIAKLVWTQATAWIYCGSVAR